jgi:hypothetical protein
MNYSKTKQIAKDIFFGTAILGVFIAAEHYDIRMHQRCMNMLYSDGKKYSDLRDAPDANRIDDSRFRLYDFNPEEDSELRKTVNEFISVQNEKYFSELQRRDGR